MTTKNILSILLLAIFVLGAKIYYDLHQIKYPPPVVDRNGNTAKNVELSWQTTLQLAAVYKWTLLGSDSGFINQQVMQTTKNAGIKWNRPLPPETREHEVTTFALNNQIDIEPWEWEKPANEYQTINEFFARRYHPESKLHPQHFFDESAANDIGSVAEGKIVAYADVKESQRFWIKNEAFTLEKTGLPDWQDYLNHPMAIFRLAPYDYHRFHAPISGAVVHMSSSDNYEETWSHSVKPMILHHPDFNLFNENRRRFLILENEYGRVALMFVGAVTVDSITFSDQIELGYTVSKGEDLGTFNYGGSTVVMFTDSDQFTFAEDILNQSREKIELQVRCGESIGTVGGRG